MGLEHFDVHIEHTVQEFRVIINANSPMGLALPGLASLRYNTSQADLMTELDVRFLSSIAT